MDDTLFDINFKVDSPQVVAVVGRVGSGKSSLIQVRSTFTVFFCSRLASNDMVSLNSNPDGTYTNKHFICGAEIFFL